MHVHILRCGEVEIPDVEFSQVSAIPTRQELKLIDTTAAQILPEDPTPSLDEIARQPDVSHLGTPQFAPQHIDTPFRIVVVGNDAALSAVLTRMMRADYMWAEVGFVPTSHTTAAQNWDLPTDLDAAMKLALEGAVRPVPLIRNDTGLAVAGSATVSAWDNGPMTGEIIVDDTTIARGESTKGSPFGARLVPMVDAPGILAAAAISPVANPRALGLDVTEGTEGTGGTAETGLLARWKRRFAQTPELGQLDPSSARTGRALQAGGPELRVIVDGVSGKRSVNRSTFYRHLRDVQIVRPE